jgi:DNA-binding MarR family transcriptional regulator
LIFEPQQTQDVDKITSYDPLYWSDKIIAVEVETDPTKHESQLVENFRKNFELNYDIWFVVFSQKHKQYIIDAMGKNGIAKQFYNIVLVPPESVERLSNVKNNSVANLTREELEVYNALKDGGTVPRITEKTHFSSYDVMGILWKLEQKEVAERGYVETKKTEHDLVSGKKITETKRQEYFIPTEEGKKLAENSNSHNLEAEQKNDTAVLYDTKDKKSAGFDFSKLSDKGLKDLVLDPECGTLAKRLLENRGNYVHVKDGKVTIRKKSR